MTRKFETVPKRQQTINFEKPVYDALVAHCERNGVSVSAEVSEIVRFWLDGVLDRGAKGEAP